MTKQTSMAMADNDGRDEVDRMSQRERLVNDLAWLVVRSHRRRNTAPSTGRTHRHNGARKRQNSKC